MAHDHTTNGCAGCSGASQVEIVQRYAALVAEYGWAVVSVISDKEPAWLYTVGLQSSFDHPELVIHGLHPEQGHSLLVGAVDLIRKGKRFEGGTVTDELLGGGYGMAIVKVDEPLNPLYPLNIDTFFTPAEQIEAVQLVWPNVNHIYPWGPGGQTEQVVFGTFHTKEQA